MFDPDDLVPCGQCGCSVQFSDLNDQNICPDCLYDNQLIKEAVGDEADWIDKIPVIRSTNITSFS